MCAHIQYIISYLMHWNTPDIYSMIAVVCFCFFLSNEALALEYEKRIKLTEHNEQGLSLSFANDIQN